MTTYLFPGQGSQIKGMGNTLFDEFPKLTRKADELLGYSIKALCLDDENNLLHKTQYTQPALYVVNALSYQQKIKHMGKTPDFVVGHSLGEYNALQASGAFNFEMGLELVRKRGELMSQAAKGAMAAVLGMPEKNIKECLETNHLNKIDIANYNAPSQLVISGLEEDISTAQTYFEKAGALYIVLNTSGAFHSRQMASAKTQFEKYLKEFEFDDLQIPIISNTHAKPYEQDKITQNLADQIDHSVKWSQSIQYLLERDEVEFEELGVGDVLKKLVKTIQQDFIAMEQNKKMIPSSTHTQSSQENEPEIANTTSVKSTEINGRTSQKIETEALHKSIIDWNNTFPIGTRVNVKGYEDKLRTSTCAKLLFGHRAAIYMDGYNGYFSLDDVTAV